jgi:tetratricopeptide (TPR) repeat protein
MHDTLDLEALKKQIEQLKAESQRYRRWTRYFTIVGIVTLGASFFQSSSDDILDLTSSNLLIAEIIIYLTLFVTLSLAPTVVMWHKIRRYSARIATHAPDFVHRPNVFEIIWELRTQIWISAALVFACIFYKEIIESPQSAILLYAPLAIVFTIDWSFTYWISKGDLPLINAALKAFPHSHRLLYFRVEKSLQNENVAEAETIILKLLSSRTDYGNPNVDTELFLLSECLTYQKRFDEVVPILEAVIKINPTATIGYASLADWYLDQGVDAERAVDLLDIAIANTAPKAIVLYALHHAMIAQSLALTGQFIRAKTSLEIGLGTLDKMPAVVAADTYRRAGYVYKALGETETARSHFNHAVELDPNGLYGDLARKALHSLTVTTDTAPATP